MPHDSFPPTETRRRISGVAGSRSVGAFKYGETMADPRNYKFSDPDQMSMQITPIGAAYVEALPDRKKAKAIDREFKKNARCPVSAIFNAEQVVAFYKARGQKVTAIIPEPQPSDFYTASP